VRGFSRHGKAVDVAEIVEIAKIDDPAHRVRKPFPKIGAVNGQECKEGCSSRVHEGGRKGIARALKSSHTHRKNRQVDETYRRFIAAEGIQDWNQIGPSALKVMGEPCDGIIDENAASNHYRIGRGCGMKALSAL
jgi:hypothetical protein